MFCGEASVCLLLMKSGIESFTSRVDPGQRKKTNIVMAQLGDTCCGSKAERSQLASELFVVITSGSQILFVLCKIGCLADGE